MRSRGDAPSRKTHVSNSSATASGDSSAAALASSAAAPGTKPADEPELGFDQVLDRLRQVVQRLEQGSPSLEQALLAFEDGVKLSRRGSAILDAAEQRVELLIQQEDGSERRQPFVSGASQPNPT